MEVLRVSNARAVGIASQIRVPGVCLRRILIAWGFVRLIVRCVDYGGGRRSEGDVVGSADFGRWTSDFFSVS